MLSTIFLTISTLAVTGQIRFEYNSLIRNDTAILYKGIENKIKIQGYELDDRCKLIVHNKALTKEADRYRTNAQSDYYVSFSKGSEAAVSLIRNSDTLYSQVVSIEKLPNPRLQYGQIRDFQATKTELIADPTLTIKLDDCLFDHGFRVISFDLSFIVSPGDTLNNFETVKGPNLNSNHIRVIDGLKRGNKIMFHRAKVTCPDCAIREMPPLVIRII